MADFCDHFQNLKVEKIANFVKKSKFKCSNTKHIDHQYNLCLHCGEVRCNGANSSNGNKQCSRQHHQASQHSLVLKLLSCYIYCYSCEIQIESMIQEHKELNIVNKNHNITKKLEKIQGLYGKIRELSIKNLPNIQQSKIQYKDSSEVKLKDKGLEGKFRNVNYQHGAYKKQLRIFGLANIGNTCYFNSILQCLYSIPEIHCLYQNQQFSDDFNTIFKKFLFNSEKVFIPKNLFAALSKSHRFLKGMGQQDAFQLYVLLIDSLIESSGSKNQAFSKKVEKSIGRIFGFECYNRIECFSCGKILWAKDFNLGLTIPFARSTSKTIEFPTDQQISKEEIGQQGLFYPKQTVEKTFLDNYFSAELLSKQNSYKCEKCSESNSSRKFYIRSPPEVLTINFKRFNNTGAKVNTYVNIPTELNLDSYCLSRGSYQYEIVAGAVHSGSSRGGHYTAYTKRNNQWHYFSDSHSKRSSFSSLKQSNPYIIFYKRKYNIQQQQQRQKVEERQY